MHEYVADNQSGAGNCVCGRAYAHRLHPHEFAKAMREADRGGITGCVCGEMRLSNIHKESA